MRPVHAILVAALLVVPFANRLRAAAILPIPIPFQTLDKGFFSSWPNGVANLVVKRQATWQRVWNLHAPGSPVPFVNFAQNDVYCAFLGQQTSGGHDVEVTDVSTDGALVDAVVKDTHPGPFCNVIAIITAPYHFVLVPKLPLPIQFTQDTVVTNCP